MNRRAYTMVELVMVVVVVAIVTSWVLPDSNTRSKQESESAGIKLETDISYARSLSIARPDDPIVVKFDAADDRYWLARASDENTPILHPLSGQPYHVMFGANTNCGLAQVDILATDLGGDDVLKFKGTGDLDQSTEAVVQMSAGGTSCEVLIAPSSGDCSVSNVITKTIAIVPTIDDDPPATGDVLLN